MGRKGRETRRRLINTTVGLLRKSRLRDLSVAEIARGAATSPATFYLYFPDVSDAVLAGLEELTQSGDDVLKLVGSDWGAGDAMPRAERLVELYLRYWADHDALFRVRNLAADEGDARFIKARTDAISGLLHAIEAAVCRARESGWIVEALDPGATAGVLMAMLERLAAVQFHYSRTEVLRREMMRSAAYLIAQTLAPPAMRG